MICQIFNSILNNCFEGSVRVVLGVFSFEYRFESCHHYYFLKSRSQTMLNGFLLGCSFLLERN